MWVKLFVAACLLAGSVEAKCSADNCYRALFPCPSPSAVSAASAFCATITAGGTTATNYPTRATAACGTSAARYISACACGPTCSSTPTSTDCAKPTPPNIVPNGDFECGLAPWTTQVPDPLATPSVTGPSHENLLAFQVNLTAPPIDQDQGVDARILSPPIPVVVGQTYVLKFRTYFNTFPCGFVGVMVNNVPIYDVDAGDHGWGDYTYNEVQYTPSVSPITLRFEWLLGPNACVSRIDTIVMKPL